MARQYGASIQVSHHRANAPKPEAPANPQSCRSIASLTGFRTGRRPVAPWMRHRAGVGKRVPRGRIELPTLRFSVECSTTELPRPETWDIYFAEGYLFS